MDFLLSVITGHLYSMCCYVLSVRHLLSISGFFSMLWIFFLTVCTRISCGANTHTDAPYLYLHVQFTPLTRTGLSCRVCVGGVNRIGDKSRLFSVVLNILETEQFCPDLSAV